MKSYLTRFAKLSFWGQGAVDFIFGQRGQAYFGGNVIAVSSRGCVTASGRESNDNTSCRCSEQPWLLQVDLLICRMKDVFNQNTITLTPRAAAGTAGHVFLGRPWQGWFFNF